MSHKNILFYRGDQSVSVDFSATEISRDGSLILLEKLERENKLLTYFGKLLPDNLLLTAEHSRAQQSTAVKATGVYINAWLCRYKQRNAFTKRPIV